MLAFIGPVLGARVIAYALRNCVGWLFLAVGVTASLTVAAAGWSSFPAVYWIRDWSWWPSLALLSLIASLFPTGHAPSPRWRPVVWMYVAWCRSGHSGLCGRRDVQSAGLYGQ